MVTIAVGVFGFVSYQRLALTLMPDMSYPALTVRTTYPGTAPEEIENIVSRPLEQQLGIIPKLVSISSVSKAGQSDVVLEFQWKTDMDLVAQEVREKIDRIRFPEGAERPLLLHFDPSLDPILRLGLAGPQSLYDLRHLADNEVKRKLEAIPGVAAIQIKGGLEEQFLVALDESKLATLRLDISQISSRLQQGNVNMSGGNLREGQTEYLIRTLNEFRSMDEIGTLIVGRQNNVDIRLSDIATVSRFHEDRKVITRVNGQESVEVEVYKEADANVLVVAAAVKEAIFGTAAQQAYVAGKPVQPPPEKPRGKPGKTSRSKKAQSPAEMAMAQQLASRNSAQSLVTHRNNTDFLAYQLRPDTTLQVLSDQSVFIRNSINEVQSNALFGGLIAITVLFLFLRNLTQTIIVSLCIPISILATFAPMQMSGVTLNIISLGGLALGVGNLVDNAIVVLESIFRCREEGDDPVTAVVRGTSEVAAPVVASTLTTVAVFFPIVFVEGVAGQVFGDMALAVVFSQLASLVAALYLIPMLAGKAAGATVALSAANSGGAVAAATLRSSGFLQFPGHTGGSRIAHSLRLIGIVIGRILWGLILILAVAIKATLLLIGFALAPLWVIADLATRRPRLWSRFAAWASADHLGPLPSVRVWPGMLAFTSVTRFGHDITAISRWFVARPWRWLGLLVIPAVVVTAFLIARSQGVWATSAAPTMGPTGGFIPGGFGAPAMPGAPWYAGLRKWFLSQPWWMIAGILVPGIIPFIFVVGRFVVEVTLRLVGTTVQTVALVVVQILVGTFRAVALVVGPITKVALDAFERGNSAAQRQYPGILVTSLRYRFAVLGGAATTMALCIFLILPRLGSDLIPQVHQGEFNLDISLPIGTPIERTGEIAERIDTKVRDQASVARTAITVGAEEGASTSSDVGEHTARITVRMAEGSDAEAEMALIDQIRAEFRSVPEMKLEVSYPALFSFKSPIEVEVRGHDLATLKRLSREAEDVLSTVPGLVDIRSMLQSGHPEIQVVYQRDRLAEYGLSLRNVADIVRNKVQGRPATQFRQEDQLIDIVVRLREEDRFGIEELRRLVVNPNGAVPISLSSVAELTVTEGPSQIRRVDQQRTALITANVKGADLATVSRDIVSAMELISYPPGFSYNLAGQNKEMKTSLDSLLLAFALAVFLVYIVMASQFESLVQPLLIMMTIPLALIGVICALWLLGIPVTIMVFLGLILLVGIVVNNAIVLVDYINTLRRRGVEKKEAIVEAGRARLRPILMTATTTIVGLLPMALGMGEGAEIRAPMAITVIVGLTTATVLTLIVIPTLYFQFTSDRPMTRPGESDVTSEAQPEPVPMGK